MIWVSLDLFSFIMFVTWKNCVFSDSLITPHRPPHITTNINKNTG